MKPILRILLPLALSGQLAGAAVLSVGTHADPIVPGACWDQAAGIYWLPPITSSFTLNGLGGQGTVFSRATSLIGGNGSIGVLHEYQLDLSSVFQTSGGQHCVTLEVYFGSTVSCDFDTNAIPDQVMVIGSGTNLGVLSATRNAGVVAMAFGGTSCLGPGLKTRNFGMISDLLPRVGQVTVVHTVEDAAGGVTNVYRYPVKALVPDIPPEITALLAPGFQAVLKNTNSGSAFNGLVEMQMSLFNAPAAGQQISFTFTQAVTAANGVFTSPMPFEPTDFVGAGRWLELAVRPGGSNAPFTTLSPRLPVSPSPQAIYAYGAGSVASLKPGQAVTSLNGLTDAVLLEAGSGIQITTNGQSLVISTVFFPSGPASRSDRALKENVQPLDARAVLEKLAVLPISRWSYKAEAGVQHFGPMAQDFHAAFGVGEDDRHIRMVDADGVALAAIQGLNQKVEEQRAELRQKQTEITELKQRLEKLERFINPNGGAK